MADINMDGVHIPPELADCVTIVAQQQINVKGGGTMPQIEDMVKILRELTEEERLIVMGGMMALKARREAAGDAA